MTEGIMTTGEKFYCLIQDIEEYMQHNNLEQDKELDFILNQSEKLQSDYARLEQENKDLKKQIESDKGLITVGGKQQYEYLQKIDKLEQENKELKTKLDVFAFTISQYESALEEIKNSVINYLPKENYKFTKSFNPEQFELFENILNKINEVLNVK